MRQALRTWLTKFLRSSGEPMAEPPPVAIIIETAAMNKRLQDIGISAARELEISLRDRLSTPGGPAVPGKRTGERRRPA